MEVINSYWIFPSVCQADISRYISIACYTVYRCMVITTGSKLNVLNFLRWELQINWGTPRLFRNILFCYILYYSVAFVQFTYYVRHNKHYFCISGITSMFSKWLTINAFRFWIVCIQICMWDVFLSFFRACLKTLLMFRLSHQNIHM